MDEMLRNFGQGFFGGDLRSGAQGPWGGHLQPTPPHPREENGSKRDLMLREPPVAPVMAMVAMALRCGARGGARTPFGGRPVWTPGARGRGPRREAAPAPPDTWHRRGARAQPPWQCECTRRRACRRRCAPWQGRASTRWRAHRRCWAEPVPLPGRAPPGGPRFARAAPGRAGFANPTWLKQRRRGDQHVH